MKAVYDMTQKEFEEHVNQSGFVLYGGKGEIKKLKKYFSGDDLQFGLGTDWYGNRVLRVTAYNPRCGKEDDTVYRTLEYSY